MSLVSPEILVLILVTFLLAGMVKGIIGLGLPTVALAMLALTIGLKEAMALMAIPALLTNFWQGISGGEFKAAVKRLWPLILTTVIGTWFAAGVLARSDALLLSAILGVLLICYAAVSLTRFRLIVPTNQEPWLGPIVGLISGIFSGLTGSFVIPGVLYLQALGMPRDVLIQAMGIIFSVMALTLATALTRHGILTTDIGIASVAALAPAFAGMWLGQRIQVRLSEDRFRRVFFIALLLVGIYITIRPFVFV